MLASLEPALTAPREAGERFVHHIAVLDQEGEPVTDLGAFPGAQKARAFINPAGPRLYVASGDSTILVGDGNSTEMTEYSTSGVLLRRVRLPISQEPMSEEEYREYFERLAQMVVESYRETVRDAADLPGLRPDLTPAYREIIDSPGAGFWVRRAAFPNPEGWLWIEPDTGTSASLILPFSLHEEARMIAGSRNFVVFLDLDDLGVETVRVFATGLGGLGRSGLQ